MACFSVGFWAGRGGQGGCFWLSFFFFFSYLRFGMEEKRQLISVSVGFPGPGLGRMKDREVGLVWMDTLFFAQEDLETIRGR